MEFKIIAALLSGVFSIPGFLLYLKEINNSQTKPSLGAWFLFMSVGLLNFNSQLEVGTWLTAVVPAIYLGGRVSIFALLYVPVAREEDFYDTAVRLAKASFAVCIMILLLTVSKYETVGTMWTIIPDAVGVGFTVYKITRNPKAEKPTGWIWWFAGSLVSLLAVSNWSSLEWVRPVYYTVVNGGIAVLIIVKNRK